MKGGGGGGGPTAVTAATFNFTSWGGLTAVTAVKFNLPSWGEGGPTAVKFNFTYTLFRKLRSLCPSDIPRGARVGH